MAVTDAPLRTAATARRNPTVPQASAPSAGGTPPRARPLPCRQAVRAGQIVSVRHPPACALRDGGSWVYGRHAVWRR